MANMRYPVDYIGVTNYPHQGKCIDFGWNASVGGPNNEPIYSCGDGTVIYSKYQTTGGNVVVIEHANGIKSSYGHLKSVSVNLNQKVTLGQQIGIMGETGTDATGVHLHFGLYSKNLASYLYDSDLDPFQYLYVYPGQTVATATLNKYGSQIKYENGSSTKEMYVYNVDDEGLVVRSSPNGSATGKLLPVAEKVTVYETSNGWSRIGTNQWVSSTYLSSTCPTYYVVSGADSEGLNVRNKPSTSGSVVNIIKNGTRVQIYATSGTWAKVSLNEERWCSKNYLVKAN